MKSITALVLCLATAASALQLPLYAPDAGDRSKSIIGKSDGGVHASTNWEFTDCGSSRHDSASSNANGNFFEQATLQTLLR